VVVALVEPEPEQAVAVRVHVVDPARDLELPALNWRRRVRQIDGEERIRLLEGDGVGTLTVEAHALQALRPRQHHLHRAEWHDAHRRLDRERLDHRHLIRSPSEWLTDDPEHALVLIHLPTTLHLPTDLDAVTEDHSTRRIRHIHDLDDRSLGLTARTPSRARDEQALVGRGQALAPSVRVLRFLERQRVD